MPELRIASSMSAVDRRRWDPLFPDAIEDADYLAAVENAELPGFDVRYVLVEEGGRLLAAAPAFVTAYALATTLSGRRREAVERVARLAPGGFALRLACLGSPCTEQAMIGFAPGLADVARGLLMLRILDGLADIARAERCGLMAVKDVASDDPTPWRLATAARGYQSLPGQPIAGLEIQFDSLDAYLATLGPGTRRDMRRKLRARGAVRVELRADVSECIEAVMALYHQTRARADMTFETLTPAFFLGVTREMPGRAFYALYFHGERLIAVNLLIARGDVLLDKFFCMDEAEGRPLNLYFLSWFTNVEICLRRGLRRYQAGQAAYENKLRLGCDLVRTRNLFRHRNALVHAALGCAAPLFGADPVPEVAA